MKRLSIAILAVMGGTALVASAANAQSWGYNSYMAHQAYHSADVRAIEARRDQHSANVAAYYGDYGAARAYAHAADVRSAQAWHDARFSRHEGYDARHAYWRGY